ncbi:ABC transporter substrate-binding protein [Oceanispirochaeta sp.]|jgi:ABC-type glycerol-3-phosphate transport system substrate-binding protein|uniref:ABC transporter substrate-binding protein n=1 Tax=Oceanispirochaeta sp. TaxID=2035350 RepID=UPI00260BD653|nr:ABC transporter substrate-binding protein [Oceanispirochaeta sp.]MDA3955636.1 ABC transporter substrate-binding protein [Oceanispirochaeta sp.]
MRRIKMVLLLLVYLFINFSFLGCQAKKSEKALEKQPRIKEKIILTVLAGQSTSDPGIEEIFTEVIEKRIPGVELFWERMDWGEQFESQMLIRFAAGEIPDIMIGKAQDIKIYAPTGNIAEIPDNLVELIRPEIIPSVSISDRVYGLPYNAFYQGVLYNKDIFEDNNIPIPQNRQELETVIVRLNSLGIHPFAAHFEETWYTANIFMQVAIGEIFSKNQDWGNQYRSGSISFIENESIRNCFENLETILDNSWSDVMSVNLFECDGRFAASKAAMYLTGTWSLQNIEALNPSLRIGIFPFPNRDGDAKLIIEPNLTFMKSTSPEHSELIDKVFQVLLEDEVLANQISDYTKTTTVLRSISPQYPQKIQEDILTFEQNDQVIDATIGNSQLVWTFQEALAQKTVEWLRGSMTLESVLEYADQLNVSD